MKFSGFIQEKMGLYFPARRIPDLERALHSLTEEMGLRDIGQTVDHFTSGILTRGSLELLASKLSVGETYFFREKTAFDILRTDMLGPLIEERRKTTKHLRLWSAGCATGEEAYSLAMELVLIIPDLADWNIFILGTDFNPDYLMKAKTGVYTEWSFRKVPEDVKRTFFRITPENRYELIPSIRQMVTFSYLNLAEDTFPSPLTQTSSMDIVFCRNVMLYFDQRLKNRLLNRFYESLVPGGCLVVGASEGINLVPQGMKLLRPNCMVAFQKEPLPQREVMVPVQTIQAAAATKNSVPAPPIELEMAEKTPAGFTVKEQLEHSQALYDQRDYHAVIRLMTEIVKDANHQGQLAEITILGAKAFANIGELATAAEWCERAIWFDQVNPELYALYASVLEERGMPKQAISALRKALFLKPDSVINHFTIATLYEHEENRLEADKYFRGAVELLRKLDEDSALPGAEGMTAGRMMQIILARSGGEK
ncbi:MAG: CheR family methyltransferase [Solirubrobacterales bacterium]